MAAIVFAGLTAVYKVRLFSISPASRFPPATILAQQGFNLFYQFWIHTETVRVAERDAAHQRSTLASPTGSASSRAEG
jgi:hypothetical protein